MKLLGYYVLNISQYIENQQVQSSKHTVHPVSRSVSDLVNQIDCHTIVSSQLRPLRLEFPRFDGSDAPHWTFRVE